MTQTETHYLGLVVAQDGRLLADLLVQHTPSVNDLARLLADAMRRPLTEGPHRPQAVHLRKNPRWTDLFPALTQRPGGHAVRNHRVRALLDMGGRDKATFVRQGDTGWLMEGHIVWDRFPDQRWPANTPTSIREGEHFEIIREN